MSQKDKILSLLKANGSMTQGQLAEAMYGDKNHSPAIYSTLMLLVNTQVITRTDEYPAHYEIHNYPDQNTFVSTEEQNPNAFSREVASHTSMSVNSAIRFIRDYFNETIRDEHGRYLSWAHCYQAFVNYRKMPDENTVDYLSLHLAFYLASWGMYRGSSFLLQKDYKIHVPVVRLVLNKKYTPLQGISAEALCQKSSLSLLEELSARIRKCYADEKPSFEGIPNRTTDTLVTKILLGTLGCVPAYDRYYVQSVKQYGISSGIFNPSSVYNIAKYYCDNLDEFEKLRKELSSHGIEYPPMKLMDMCFWQAGFSSGGQQE